VATILIVFSQLSDGLCGDTSTLIQNEACLFQVNLIDLKVNGIENFKARDASSLCKASLAHIYTVWRQIVLFGYIPIKTEVAFKLICRNFVDFHL
jgi:hypothetical protein